MLRRQLANGVHTSWVSTEHRALEVDRFEPQRTQVAHDTFDGRSFVGKGDVYAFGVFGYACAVVEAQHVEEEPFAFDGALAQ
jgi:hypothetical protein